MISLSIEDEAGHGPVGMLPLFDGNIVDKQVESAQNMGAKKIILLSPIMHAGLWRYADGLKVRNIDIEIVRDAGDLIQYASPQDDLLFMSDGVFPGESIEQALRKQRDELIYVVANDEIYSGFERIDLSHRWLGIALFKAYRLEEISQIPEDWDIGSALLRTAVQSGCDRTLVSDADMQKYATVRLPDAHTSAEYAKGQVGNVHIPRQNFFDRYISWPLMRRAIPLLWEAPDAKKYISATSLACAAIAVGFSIIVWPVASLAFLFLGALSLLLHSRISIFSFGNGKSRLTGPIFYLLGAAALTVNVVRNAHPEALAAALTILAILFCLLWVVRTVPDIAALNWMKPDSVLILGILLVASLFGYLAIGFYVCALFCAAYVAIAHSRRFTADSQG